MANANDGARLPLSVSRSALMRWGEEAVPLSLSLTNCPTLFFFFFFDSTHHLVQSSLSNNYVVCSCRKEAKSNGVEFICQRFFFLFNFFLLQMMPPSPKEKKQTKTAGEKKESCCSRAGGRLFFLPLHKYNKLVNVLHVRGAQHACPPHPVVKLITCHSKWKDRKREWFTGGD